MRNFIYFCLLIFSFSLIIAGCDKNEQVYFDKLDFKTIEIQDSLAVYEVINGQRVKSTKYRLLTKEERELLIQKGWILDFPLGRAQDCRWGDDMANPMECGDGTVRCGVITAPVGQVCLACFDANDNMINAGHCRDQY